MEQSQRLMIAHGLGVAFIGMLAGFFLLFSLIGGIEIWPGKIVSFELFGTTDGWVRAHTGGLLNGIFVILLALCLPKFAVSAKTTRFIAWGMIYSAWSFTVFYWAGNAASNRALTMGENVFGPSDWLGLIGFVPAIPSIIIVPIILIIGARAVLRQSA